MADAAITKAVGATATAAEVEDAVEADGSKVAEAEVGIITTKAVEADTNRMNKDKAIKDITISIRTKEPTVTNKDTTTGTDSSSSSHSSSKGHRRSSNKDHRHLRVAMGSASTLARRRGHRQRLWRHEAPMLRNEQDHGVSD